MIFRDIKRRCGHEEQIGIAGYSGQVEDISNLKDKQAIWDHIKNAEGKLCLPCLKNLPNKELSQENKYAIMAMVNCAKRFGMSVKELERRLKRHNKKRI